MFLATLNNLNLRVLITSQVVMVYICFVFRKLVIKTVSLFKFLSIYPFIFIHVCSGVYVGGDGWMDSAPLGYFSGDIFITAIAY